jgi:hypothetical protein
MRTLQLVVFLCVLSVPALADRGIVSHKQSGCDYFVVETNSGYDVFEWYGGYDPDKGDVLVGKFNSYGMRDIYDEIRMLRWNQIDISKGELRVGASKTEHGEDRVIPLNIRVRTVLEFWSERFPNRKPNEFVFPFEKYGGKGQDDVIGFAGSVAYLTDPTKPVGEWKEG